MEVVINDKYANTHTSVAPLLVSLAPYVQEAYQSDQDRRSPPLDRISVANVSGEQSSVGLNAPGCKTNENHTRWTFA